MLVAVLHFIPDALERARIVSTLLDALPSGSYLAASHGTTEYDPVGVSAWERVYRDRGVAGRARTADEFALLAFRGLEMVEPGLVVVPEWHPEMTGPWPPAAEVSINGGVARKP